jgi:hypothetical protein
MRLAALIVAALVLACLAAAPARSEDRYYYVAVDTSSQAEVEQALRGLQSRYAIKYGPLGAAPPAAVPPSIHPAEPVPLTLKIDHKTRSSGRIPQNDREFHELSAAAREGPAACYAWIYGKDSPLVQKLQGHVWSDLGDGEAVQQCRTEASRVRAARSFLGM